MPFITLVKRNQGLVFEYYIVGEEQWVRKDPPRFELELEGEEGKGERRSSITDIDDVAGRHRHVRTHSGSQL